MILQINLKYLNTGTLASLVSTVREAVLVAGIPMRCCVILHVSNMPKAAPY